MSFIDAFELDSFVFLLLFRLLTTGPLSVAFTFAFTFCVAELRLVDIVFIFDSAGIIHCSERNIPKGQQFVWSEPLLATNFAVVDVGAVE